MTSQKICNLAAIATKTLDKSVAAIVSIAALEQYSKIVDLLKQYTGIDINEFFGIIALLAVLCWVGHWLEEIFHFICVTIPKFFHNLCRGKLSLCLLDCDRSHSSHSSHKTHKTDDTEY
jgi:hypothetical protein